jgi:hypothetical protein
MLNVVTGLVDTEQGRVGVHVPVMVRVPSTCEPPTKKKRTRPPVREPLGGRTVVVNTSGVPSGDGTDGDTVGVVTIGVGRTTAG